jgi:hypothetical protein
MNKLLFGAVLMLALQASDCATAGSIQDSSVTKAKREADAQPQPTPFDDGAPLDAHTSKRVRNAMGMSDGWTTDAIRREDAERARHQRRLAEWQAQNGGAK